MNKQTKKKLTWAKLERYGLNKDLYSEYCNTIDNIENIFFEALELFEHNFICPNLRNEFKNLFQLSAMLDNEMEKSEKIIDLVLAKANELQKIN